MNPSDRERQRLDEAVRGALQAVTPLPTALAQTTARRGRSALMRPGEGTLSVRGARYFTESTGMAALVLLAGLSYAIIEAMRAGVIYGG
jgi:hypothetical protein